LSVAASSIAHRFVVQRPLRRQAGGEEAAAAQRGHSEARVVSQAGGRLESDLGHRFSPRPHGLESGCADTLHHFGEGPHVDRHLVGRQAPEPDVLVRAPAGTLVITTSRLGAEASGERSGNPAGRGSFSQRCRTMSARSGGPGPRAGGVPHAVPADEQATATIRELIDGRGCEASINCSGSGAARTVTPEEHPNLGAVRLRR
jgi:hypothetical protein